MAMTPRVGTLLSRPRPAAAAVRPVYEDIRPMTEWKKDEESNSLLLIYLPGFQKEHLKVSTEGRNILRARGERIVAGNKWSRFQEDYPLPEDCNIRGISAKFEGGILTITIPRKREAQDASKEEADKPSKRTKEDLSTGKRPSPSKAAMEKRHQEAADDNAGPSSIPSVDVAENGREEKPLETLPDQKMLTQKPKMWPYEKPAEKSKEETGYQKSTLKRNAQTETKLKMGPNQFGDIIRENTRKPKSQNDEGNMEPKEKETATASGTSSGTDFRVANYKQAVKKFMDLNEERQLLVNVGVAVLVIVAFGAYVYYAFQDKRHDI